MTGHSLYCILLIASSCTLHFTCCTLHVALYTFHFTYSTLHIPHVAFYTLSFARCTLHVAPYMLDFTYFTLHIAFLYIIFYTQRRKVTLSLPELLVADKKGRAVHSNFHMGLGVYRWVFWPVDDLCPEYQMTRLSLWYDYWSPILYSKYSNKK